MPLPSYGQLRNRENAHWYTKEMEKFLYEQFENVNPPIKLFKKIEFEFTSFFAHISFKIRKFIFKLHFRDALKRLIKILS